MSKWIPLFVLFILASICTADPFFTKLLYQSVPHRFCSRYYHRHGGTGCHTSTDGSSGNNILFSNSTIGIINQRKDDSYVVLISTEDFPKAVTDLIEKEAVKGIIVYGTQQSTIHYSPMSKTPGGKGTPSEFIALHKDIEWNPNGLNYFNRDLTKPIIHVSDEKTIQELLSKAHLNQQISHSYIAKSSIYMGPEVMNSSLCLAKEACQPIGGQSVWSGDTQSSKPIILITTALDSLSDFYDSSNPADAGVTLSIVLTLAKALSDVESMDSEVMFAFFQGESWGRVGSRRFLQEIQHFQCNRIINQTESVFNSRMCYSPLKLSLEFQSFPLDMVKEVVVLDQLMSHSGELYSHSETSIDHHHIRKGRSMIPPGIGESFIQDTLVAVDVVTGYNEEYHPYYGSSLNTVGDESFPVILNVTNTLLNEFVWKMGITSHVTVDEDYLKQLVVCLAMNGTCSIIENVLGLKKNSITHSLHGQPLSTYPGTFSDGRQPYLILSDGHRCIDYKEGALNNCMGIFFNPSILESFVHSELTLSYHSSIPDTNCTSWKDCKGFSNGYCILGKCYQSHAHYHDAYDLGLIPLNSNEFTINPDVNNTPIFTEPYWEGYFGSHPFTHVYQKTTLFTEVSMFICGLAVTAIAWLLTVLAFKNYGDQLRLGK